VRFGATVCGVALLVAACGGKGGNSGTTGTAGAGESASPVTVESITPAKGARAVNGTDTVSVTFSAPLAANSPKPVITPATAGTWKASGATETFTPSTPFGTRTKVTVRVPSGEKGVRSSSGGILAKTISQRFTTAGAPTLRVEQILAQLGYLPLTWSPSGGASLPAADTADQLKAAYSPPNGSFRWSGGYPSTLKKFWSSGSANLVEKGAVMAFENDHGLGMDGEAGPHVWKELLAAVAKSEDNTHGYTYAVTSKSSPETLTIYHNGRQVFRTDANTGISSRPTGDGTFPVYLRYRNQIMRGTNPDGTKYADPVQYVAYFNGSDAVHYYPRASYGFPQSLGCVELPLSAAATAWPYLSYGSLVTVEG
jgi:hypothetical protein